MQLNIEKLTENFGAQINNFDCSKTLEVNELEILKNTMQNSHFICFKNQKLDGNS